MPHASASEAAETGVGLGGVAMAGAQSLMYSKTSHAPGFKTKHSLARSGRRRAVIPRGQFADYAAPLRSDPRHRTRRFEIEHLGLPLPQSDHNPLPRHDDGDSVLSGCYCDNKICLVSLGHVFSIPAYVDPVKAYGDRRPDRYQVVT
jgi:hypothetical protein